jgi:hypothetical protein
MKDSQTPDDSGAEENYFEFTDQLATICEGAAHVYLGRGLQAAAADSTPAPFWEADRRGIVESIGSDEPCGWIDECVSVYLAEAANQLLAIGILLRGRTVAASLDPLVRALIERVGVVNWLLDEGITPRQRAIRGGLAWIVSLQAYCEALARLGADRETRRVFRAERSRLDQLLSEWFTIDRPATGPCDPESRPTTDRFQWRIEGETYPTFTQLAQRALARGNIDNGVAAGTYDGYSGFSHPNVIFGQEHKTVHSDGSITFRHRFIDIEKSVRFAVGSFSDGLSHCVCYFEADQLRTIGDMGEILARLESISVVVTEETENE